MPSTYSSNLRLELQATGENANTWGAKTNNNLNLVEQAITGYVKITLTSASASYVLDIADASASDGRNAFIEFVGTVASAISIVVPDVEKGYWVKNSATGASLTFRTSGGTGFTLPTNEWVFAIADGSSAVNTTPTSLSGFARLAGTQIFTGDNTFIGPVSVSASAAFTRPVGIRAALSVTGAATFTSAVTVAAPLSVTGAAVFTSTVDVSKALTVAATVASTTGGVKFPDGTLQTTAAAAATVVPAGSVFDYAGSTAPSGFLLCFGQAVSRSTYSDLFTAIGTTFGSGDGSTTFNLPDLRGRVAAGKDDMGGTAANRITSGGSGITGTTLGAAGGTQTHTLTTAQLASHNHLMSSNAASGGLCGGAELAGTNYGAPTSARYTSNEGSGQAHQNTQPTIILNKIIKT